MSYQEQRQKDPFIDPPKSPIPPLTKLQGRKKPPLAIVKPCRWCDVQLIIKRERIQDDMKGNQRHRHIPRDMKGNIHDCRHQTNNTLNREGEN